MRLKTFHAKTMKDVMDDVRNALGPDAIIVSIEQGKKVGGVRVTAAVEANNEAQPADTAPDHDPIPLEVSSDEGVFSSKDYDKGEITAVLNHHNIPFDTAARLEEGVRAVTASSLSEAFAVGLETSLRFSPLTDRTTRPLMLIGPPGAGKTVCTAKLMADALLHSRKVTIFSTDINKSGGIRQLQEYADLMKQEVIPVESPMELSNMIQKHQDLNNGRGLIVIDTQGVNPFDMKDLEILLGFIKAVDAEPIPVLPAGMDPMDSREIAEIFMKLGANRYVATRLDATRRLGNLISSSRPGGLALAAISKSPYIVDGLEPASPFLLARLITALPQGAKRKSRSE